MSNAHIRALLPVADTLEQGDTVLAARDCLAIEDTRPGSQLHEGVHYQWEAAREVVAWTAVELNAPGLLARNHSDAVVLDFVQPLVPPMGRKVLQWVDRAGLSLLEGYSDATTT
jgi:hypothetical protein